MDQIEVWQQASKELQAIRAEIFAHLLYEHSGKRLLAVPARRDFPELARLCRAFIEAWETSGG